jgi:hypothetical protein
METERRARAMTISAKIVMDRTLAPTSGEADPFAQYFLENWTSGPVNTDLWGQVVCGRVEETAAHIEDLMTSLLV